MRIVTWEDKDGWLRVSMVRDSDPDEAAPQGIPQNPPDLTLIAWEDVCKEINNTLVRRGALTWNDVQRGQTAITDAVTSAIRRRIVMLYRDRDYFEKKEKSDG